MRIAAMLASHNRRGQTLRCLDSYYRQRVDGAELSAVLVDGGSTDGTAAAVEEGFPATQVIRGDADLYWAASMAIAERAALARRPDHLLWLNDDVLLDPGALGSLVAVAAESAGPCIVVGAVRDPVDGSLTYSGVERIGRHPLRMRLVEPGPAPRQVETFNGNVVLIPRDANARTGPVDGGLVHSAADYDYGLRAARAGVRNLLAPGSAGTCARDGMRQPWLDPSLPPRERVRLLLGPKGLPPAPRARYLRRHGGLAWPVFWLSPYVRAAQAAFGRRRGSPPQAGGRTSG